MPTKIEETEILLRKVLKKHYIFFFLGISLVNLFFELIFGRSKTGPQTDVAFVLTCCGFLTQTCANLWGSVGIMGNNTTTYELVHSGTFETNLISDYQILYCT